MTNVLHLYWSLFFPSYYQIILLLSPSDLEKQEICMTVEDEAMSVVKKKKRSFPLSSFGSYLHPVGLWTNELYYFVLLPDSLVYLLCPRPVALLKIFEG